MNVTRFLWLPLLSAALAACGCGGSGDDGRPFGDYDLDWEIGDMEEAAMWIPPDEDQAGCANGYGYGPDCAPVPGQLDCSQDPCAFGVCIGGSCECWEGYAGVLCDECADGFVAVKLRCVRVDACSDFKCLYGRCIVINGRPVCECDEGYVGTVCDRCADGYHEQDLHCVPD